MNFLEPYRDEAEFLYKNFRVFILQESWKFEFTGGSHSYNIRTLNYSFDIMEDIFFITYRNNLTTFNSPPIDKSYEFLWLYCIMFTIINHYNAWWRLLIELLDLFRYIYRVAFDVFKMSRSNIVRFVMVTVRVNDGRTRGGVLNIR